MDTVTIILTREQASALRLLLEADIHNENVAPSAREHSYNILLWVNLAMME